MSADKRTQRQDKLARVHDAEVLPIWTHRFGRMLMRGFTAPQKAMVLDVTCGTGYLAGELLRKLDEQSRVIAIDPSSALLDVARKKLGDLGGKRLFFRTEDALARVPFADDVYDAVLCNLGLTEASEPERALAELARVTKPGGVVAATLPIAGTWAEFYDLFREVLVKHDKADALGRLDEYLRRQPDEADLERWLSRAGLGDRQVEVESFSLLFRSSREFFFAPVIEFGPLAAWKTIAGKGQELQDVFWYVKQAIDAYFGDRAFEVTVRAACLRGKKLAADDPARADVVSAPVPRPISDGSARHRRDDAAMAEAHAALELDGVPRARAAEIATAAATPAALAATDGSATAQHPAPEHDGDEPFTPPPPLGPATSPGTERFDDDGADELDAFKDDPPTER
jgi:ubiquinone/menaquinone biosynthesis C-methylase UbiE